LKLKIGQKQGKGIERRVYYFDLINYPHITTKELEAMLAFIKYEKSYGRETIIECEDDNISTIVNNTATSDEFIKNNYISEKVDFVYHATCVKSTCSILLDGKLLSATKVSGKTGEELAHEKRNSLWNDPADYFEYIMFCNGDDMTGDYVVLSENPPSEDDLQKGNFNAGVRFYFLYNDLIKHPGYVFDGYHPIKVKDEIDLLDYLHSCIIPAQYKNVLYDYIAPELEAKVYYLPQDNLSISDWNNKVYTFVRNLCK
jgi:hypothetical protein